MKRSVLAMLCFTFVLAGCGDSPAPEESMDETPESAEPMAEAVPTVTILEPAEGAEVEGPNVTVRLGVENLQIVLAGDMTEGTGHHHIFLDADVSPAGEPIPAVTGSIVHMGDGSSEFTFEGVAPGEHRLITVVGDGLHVPLQPWVVDTVNFVVR